MRRFTGINDIVKTYNLEKDSQLLIWPSKTPMFRPGEIDSTFFKVVRKRNNSYLYTHRGAFFLSFGKLKEEFNLENG